MLVQQPSEISWYDRIIIRIINQDNIKGIYQEKINQLLNQEQTQGFRYKKYQKRKNKGELNPQDQIIHKQQRNRVSAKTSRERKKVYLELLENKIIDLNKQCESQAQLNNQYENIIKEFKNKIYQKESKRAQKFMQNYKAQIDQQQKQDQVQMIEHYYQEIQANMIPNYMACICIEAKQNDKKLSQSQLWEKLDLSEKQKQRMDFYQKKVVESTQELVNIDSLIQQSKNMVLNEVDEIEHSYRELQANLNDDQLQSLLQEFNKIDNIDNYLDSDMELEQFIKNYSVTDEITVSTLNLLQLYLRQQ